MSDVLCSLDYGDSLLHHSSHKPSSSPVKTHHINNYYAFEWQTNVIVIGVMKVSAVCGTESSC
jgi:hypothetical protein